MSIDAIINWIPTVAIGYLMTQLPIAQVATSMTGNQQATALGFEQIISAGGSLTVAGILIYWIRNLLASLKESSIKRDELHKAIEERFMTAIQLNTDAVANFQNAVRDHSMIVAGLKESMIGFSLTVSNLMRHCEQVHAERLEALRKALQRQDGT